MEKAAVPAIRLLSGALMPSLGLGTFQGSKSGFIAALECGYRHIDTAYSYKVESNIGEVLKESLSSSRVQRKDLFITSKVPPIGMREADVGRFLRLSLRALGLEYVDLYLVHSPHCLKAQDDQTIYPLNDEGKLDWDHMDIKGVWRAMERQVDNGLAKSIGVSNFNSEQIHRLVQSARIIPCVNQVEAHLYMQQHELKDVCKRHGIRMTAYGPLGSAFLMKRKNIALILEDPVLIRIAQERKKTPAQITLRYLLQNGFVVIPKSNNPDRIRENIQVWDFQLDEDELSRLKSLDRRSKGRVWNFKDTYVGCENSNEYPFHIPY